MQTYFNKNVIMLLYVCLNLPNLIKEFRMNISPSQSGIFFVQLTALLI